MNTNAGPDVQVRASDFLVVAFFGAGGVFTWGLVSTAFEGPRRWPLVALALGGTVFFGSGAVLSRQFIRACAGDVVTGDPAKDRTATETGPVAAPFIAIGVFFVAFVVLMVALARMTDGGAVWALPVAGGSGAVALGAAAYLIARLTADRRLAQQNEPFIRQQVEEELKAELGDDCDDFIRNGPGSH